MCGRFSQTCDKKTLLNEFQNPFLGMTGDIKPGYNISPSQPVLVLLEENNQKRLDFFHWGLVPSWAKDPGIGNRIINARQETLNEKPSFRGPLKNSRCLVIADGFYEWKREGTIKQPYYIHMKNKTPFGFAGLWSHWTSTNGSEIKSCTIITTESRDLMKPIHHRMPIILPLKERDVWLDTRNFDVKGLLTLLNSTPLEQMEAYPVSSYVNSPRNSSPECTTPEVS